MLVVCLFVFFFFFFQAEDGIRDLTVTGVQTCALPISRVRACLIALPFHRSSRYVPLIPIGSARRGNRGGARLRGDREPSKNSLLSFWVKVRFLAAFRTGECECVHWTHRQVCPVPLHVTQSPGPACQQAIQAHLFIILGGIKAFPRPHTCRRALNGHTVTSRIFIGRVSIGL